MNRDVLRVLVIAGMSLIVFVGGLFLVDLFTRSPQVEALSVAPVRLPPWQPPAIEAPAVVAAPAAAAALTFEPGSSIRTIMTVPAAATSWVMAPRVSELMKAQDAVGLAQLLDRGLALRIPGKSAGRVIVDRVLRDGTHRVEFRIEESEQESLIGEAVVIPVGYVESAE